MNLEKQNESIEPQQRKLTLWNQLHFIAAPIPYSSNIILWHKRGFWERYFAGVISVIGVFFAFWVIQETVILVGKWSSKTRSHALKNLLGLFGYLEIGLWSWAISVLVGWVLGITLSG